MQGGLVPSESEGRVNVELGIIGKRHRSKTLLYSGSVRARLEFLPTRQRARMLRYAAPPSLGGNPSFLYLPLIV